LLRRWLSLFFVVSFFIGCAGFTDGAAAGRPDADAVMLRNGGSFVYVVREDGSIAGWGDNRMGQLGTTPAKLFLKPQSVAEGIDGEELADLQCGNENTLFLKKDGTVWTCGTYARGTQGLGRLNHIVSRPSP